MIYEPLFCSNCGCLININEGAEIEGKWYCDTCIKTKNEDDKDVHSNRNARRP